MSPQCTTISTSPINKPPGSVLINKKSPPSPIYLLNKTGGREKKNTKKEKKSKPKRGKIYKKPNYFFEKWR